MWDLKYYHLGQEWDLIWIWSFFFFFASLEYEIFFFFFCHLELHNFAWLPRNLVFDLHIWCREFIYYYWSLVGSNLGTNVGDINPPYFMPYDERYPCCLQGSFKSTNQLWLSFSFFLLFLVESKEHCKHIFPYYYYFFNQNPSTCSIWIDDCQLAIKPSEIILFFGWA